MEENKYTEKLARILLIAGFVCLAGGIIWYFSDVVIYIAVSGVIALIAKPLVKLLRKIRYKKFHLPSGLITLLAMIMIFGITTFMFMEIVPVLGKTLADLSSLDLHHAAEASKIYINDINNWIVQNISGVDEDFNIQEIAGQWIQQLFNIDLLTSITGSLATFLIDFGIGLFCVLFISFFFIQNNDMVANIVAKVVPDGYEEKAREAIHDIEHLLSRYFGGIFIEVTGIIILNFTGMHFIVGLDSDTALTIAAITGIFNIIPYIGPLAGGIFGTIIALLSKLISGAGMAGSMGIWGFLLLVVGILVAVHLVDVFLFQPFIYSSSIKANALEIFIVILIAGTIAGPTGMLVAVPCYTVIRVIALKFFGDKKAIKGLLDRHEQEKE